ncbi:Ribulose 1,5-bisphosphate carboxylase large subunit [Prescottella defluvii]|uniref:hypothetical protein n=1 Tax=Prescottella defluvii TaxID=1323361 RepID=UPI0004F26E71|nr:hypothetical protein [Prescottella defluvii]
MPLLPNPLQLVSTVQNVAQWSVDTATFVVGLPARVSALLDEADGLVRQVSGVVDGAARAVAAADAVIAACATLVDRTAVVASETEVVVGSAARSAAVADELLAIYRPLALDAAPLATRFVDEISEDEVHAAVALFDQLPEMTARLTALMPILATLDTVSPEIHELLEVVKDVRQAIIGVPGFGFFRRRGEDKLGEGE